MDRASRVLDMAASIANVSDLDAALNEVKLIGTAVGIPLVTFIDDLACVTAALHIAGRSTVPTSPQFERFHRIWEGRQYRLNSPVYLACRSEYLPFVWKADGHG